MRIEIKERKLIKKKVGKNGRYIQYIVTIPKSFVDKHKTDRVFWIADDLLIMAPSEDAIMKLISKIPEIEKAIKE